MYRKSVTPQQIVDYLNHLLKVDYSAIDKLCFTRIYCSKKLAEHPTVQVCKDNFGNYSVGLLGILNGLIGIDKDGWGCIAADCEANGKITKFRLLKDRMKNNMK